VMTFFEFCLKARNNDPSILPELCRPSRPFEIRHMFGREVIALATAFPENTSLELETESLTKSSAEAIAKYVRTSKHLQRIRWLEPFSMNEGVPQQREEMFCCFLPAFQESTSLKELEIDIPLLGGSSNRALENMLTHTQSLRSLTLHVLPRNIDVAKASSGLKKNTTLRELTLDFPYDTTHVTNATGAIDISPIFTSLRDHPLLQKLSLRGYMVDLTGLEIVLLSDTSKITELNIDRYCRESLPPTGLARVLEALASHPKLIKLGIQGYSLGHDETRLLQTALCNMPSLQSVAFKTFKLLGSVKFAELAPALHHNTTIKVLDISGNKLNDIESARSLRNVIRRNRTITTLDLSCNDLGRIVGAVECIADGLGSNSTLLKINLLRCGLKDGGISILAQRLGSRNTTLQKLNLDQNFITSTGVGVLLETMEQSGHPITDLDLSWNSIGSEGASLLARSLGGNALPNLTHLSLFACGIGDDGFIALVSALEQNTSLLRLNLGYQYGCSFSERALMALVKSLPEIKVLQELDFEWCEFLGSAMPSLLAGLRKNTSLFHFNLRYFATRTPEKAARCDGSWIQERDGVGCRNRCLTLIRASKETLPPLGVWPRALARVATYPDYVFEVLRSKPSLVPSGMNNAMIRSLLEQRSQGLLRLPLVLCFESLGRSWRGWCRLKLREIRKLTFRRATSAATSES
jgi:Ran GTPase-activating protein (RanGAP) involved in mRNA processing and transport